MRLDKKLLPAWNVLGLRKRTINSCQLRGSATALAQKDRQLRARSLDRSIILSPELPASKEHWQQDGMLSAVSIG